MADIRHIRDRARRQLHCAMKVPALLIVRAGDDPIRVDVRLQTKFAALKAAPDVAAMMEANPKVLMLREDVVQFGPDSKSAIFFGAGEVFMVKSVDPPDGITVTLNLARMGAKQASDFDTLEGLL